MGYYTAYRLTDVRPPEAEPVIRAALRERSGYSLGPFAEDGQDTCKWYENAEDCRAVSLEHPEVEFTVHGEGEDGEVWHVTMRAGVGERVCDRLSDDELEDAVRDAWPLVRAFGGGTFVTDGVEARPALGVPHHPVIDIDHGRDHWLSKPSDEIAADIQSLIEMHRDIGAPKPNTILLPGGVAMAIGPRRTRSPRKWWRG